MTALPPDRDAHEIVVRFAEPHTSAAAARAYLRSGRPAPLGRSWDEARLMSQSVGPRGVTFRFAFPAR
jgi:hypothetical protein